MSDGKIRVWDRFVRTAHWLLVVLFCISYITEGEPRWLHVWSGYSILALVILRIGWGFVGPERARFSDFVYGPASVFRYLHDLLARKAKRHLGHSPAGGAMTVALLLSLLATTLAGLSLYAVHDNAGPLAPWLGDGEAEVALISRAMAHEGEEEGGEGEENPLEEALETVHETLANLTLALILLHIAGVLWASHAHRENLVRAMITGEKDRRAGGSEEERGG